MAGAPAGHDVFLSYSRADAAEAEVLRASFREAGLTASLDRYALPAGRPWQPELEAALASCRALVVLLGPSGIGGWQHREIQLGLDRQNARSFPVVPVLLPRLQPDDLPLGTFLTLNTWVDLRQGLDASEALQRLIAAVQGQAIDGLTRDFASLRPYRGLLAFREQDAGLFFGRERFVDELVAKVRQRSAANVVAVLGRSGSGKSSVVFAGLFPTLRQEKGAGQQAVWQILDLRPGAEPLHALVEIFDPPDEGLTRVQKLAAINAGVELLRQRKVTLAQLVRDRLKDDPGTTRLLLYVDQWEELYTQAQPREPKTDKNQALAADARLFTDLVLDAAANSPCTLVLSVRSDFYPDLQAHDALRSTVQDCQVSLGPMTKAELTAAIEGPAKAVGGGVESELSKRLLRDVGLDRANIRADHPDIGKLPLLEYALEQAWAKAEGSRLCLAHYRGLEQALEERANSVYGRLPPEQQIAAKRLFVSLVMPGEGREDTRALISLLGDALLEEVAAAFAGSDARLIVIGNEIAGIRTVEISHEALIRHWDRLRGWIDENRANLRTRADLVAARAQWLAYGSDSTLLISPGLRLEAARRLLDEPGDVFTDDIIDYIDASIEAYLKATVVKSRRIMAERQSAAQAKAAMIWARLGIESRSLAQSADPILALWDLVLSSEIVRKAFIDLAPRSLDQIARFSVGYSGIARAIGLRRHFHDLQAMLIPILDMLPNIKDPDHLLTVARAIAPLDPTPAQALATLDPVLKAITQTVDPHQLDALAQIGVTLAPKLTAEDARALLGAIFDAICRSTDPDPDNYRPETLAQFVHILGPKLTPKQAQAAVGPVVDAVRHSIAPNQIDALVQTLQILGPKLSTEQAHTALGAVLDAIRHLTYPDGTLLRNLIQATQILSANLSSKQARDSIAPILKDIIHTTNTNHLEALAQAVHVLGAMLTPEDAQIALGMVARALRQTKRHGSPRHALQVLPPAIESLGSKLLPERTQIEIAHALNAMRQTTDSYELGALAQIIQFLHPDPEHAHIALCSISKAICQTADPYELGFLAQAAKNLGSSPEQTQVALHFVLEAFSKQADSFAIQNLAEAALALGATSEQAQTAIGELLELIGRSIHADDLLSLAQAIVLLGPGPDQVHAALAPVIDAILEPTGADQLQTLAQAVQALGPKLAPEQADAAIDVSRTVLAAAGEPDIAVAFARAIAVILPHDPAEPQTYVAAIIELLKWPTTAEPGATAALLEVLHHRVPEAPGKEAGLDATVQWVAARFPEIDLDSPPTPPASVSTGGAW